MARAGRFVKGASGTVRTLPPPASMTNLLFCAISCNGQQDGAWRQFGEFVERSQPSFIIMMGDQVYLDEDKPDIFDDHFHSDSTARRRAIAEKYRLNWSRDDIRRILANVPTYMVWDDHDIRDGWARSRPTARRWRRCTRAARRSSACRPSSSKTRATSTGTTRAVAIRCPAITAIR